MAAATQKEYDTWKGYTKDFSGIGDAGKSIDSEDLAKRGGARGTLENLIRKYDSLLVFGRHDVDSHVLKHAALAEQHFAGESLRAFIVNPQGMIEYAYQSKDGTKKFAENYLSINPTLVGVDNKGKTIAVPIPLGKTPQENFVTYLHNLYFQLNQSIEGRKEATTLKDLARLTKDTGKSLEEALVLHYSLKGNDEETAKRRARLVRETYETSTPQEAYGMLDELTSYIKQDLEEAIPEDKRAEYTLALLKAKTSNPQDIANIEIASRELYKIAK